MRSSSEALLSQPNNGLRISEAPSGAEDLNLGSGIMSSDTSLKEVGIQASLRSAPILKLP